LATNAKGEIVDINPSLCRLLDATEQQLIGRNWFELIHDASDQNGISRDVLKSLATNRIWNGEIPISGKEHNQEPCWLNLTVVPIVSEKSDVFQYTAFGFDVSEKKRLEKEVRFLAYQNELTGLYNKKGFLRQYDSILQQIDEREGLLHIALFDIDRFKIINESFGSRVGNELLVQIKERALHLIPESALLFHPTGGLFGVMYFEESKEEVFQSLRHLQHELQRPFRIYHHSIMVLISVGCVFYPSSASSLEELYTRAESALFKRYGCRILKTNSYRESLIPCVRRKTFLSRVSAEI